MKRFLIYGHGGAYNHGAEAIVRSTIRMIRAKHCDAHVAVSTHFPEQDREFAIDADVLLCPDAKAMEAERSAGSSAERGRLAREMYAESLGFMTPDTLCISVGGDNYCYPNWRRLLAFQREAAEKGAASVLWGCSVEPDAITEEMADALNSHTHILARESCTYDALRGRGIATDVQLLPDPAFLLEPEPLDMPDGFCAGDVVGVNVSPLVARRERVPGILKENMRSLVDYILRECGLKIALIPHVTMPMDNDIDALLELEASVPERFRRRVCLVGERHSAAQLKSLVSKCSVLVCARTHASIAAYSSGVPAVVLGYSVKSRGIARDVGLGEYVLDVAGIESSHSVRDVFARCLENLGRARAALAGIREYAERARGYMDYI